MCVNKESIVTNNPQIIVSLTSATPEIPVMRLKKQDSQSLHKICGLVFFNMSIPKDVFTHHTDSIYDMCV